MTLFGLGLDEITSYAYMDFREKIIVCAKKPLHKRHVNKTMFYVTFYFLKHLQNTEKLYSLTNIIFFNKY